MDIQGCEGNRQNRPRPATDLVLQQRRRYLRMECKSKAAGSHSLGEEVDPDGRLVVLVEVVVHEPGDDARLPHALVSQENQLVLRQGRDLRDRGGPAIFSAKKARMDRKRHTGGKRGARRRYYLSPARHANRRHGT